MNLAMNNPNPSITILALLRPIHLFPIQFFFKGRSIRLDGVSTFRTLSNSEILNHSASC